MLIEKKKNKCRSIYKFSALDFLATEAKKMAAKGTVTTTTTAITITIMIMITIIIIIIRSTKINKQERGREITKVRSPSIGASVSTNFFSQSFHE